MRIQDLLGALALGAVTTGLLFIATTHSADGAEFMVGPVRVVDGDTVYMGKERIRLQGIDTPERGQRCLDGKGVSYRCGRAATLALRGMVGDNYVMCVTEGRGKYGRALGTCYTMDGVDLNGWLVRHGYALAYRKYNLRYTAEEAAAWREDLGMHAGRYVAPWDWRKGERLEP